MAKCIIFEKAEGEVGIITPAGNTAIESQIKFVPKGANYEIVDVKDLPSDRLFRDAWKKNGKKVETDLIAAKDLAHQWRRAVREEEFAPLDKEVTIHIKNPTKVDEIESRRQAIRDKYEVIQTEIVDCMDENELRTVLATRKIDHR